VAVCGRRLTAEHPDGKPGMLEHIRALCAAGADPNRMNEAANATPLLGAVGLGDTEAVTILLAAGGDPNRSNSIGQAALHLAASSNLRTHLIRPLLAAGGALEARDNAGRTPLITTGWEGSSAGLTELLALGANVQALDQAGGLTTWHATTLRRYDDMGMQLLMAGCDPSVGSGLEEARYMGIFASQVERIIRQNQALPPAQRQLGAIANSLAALLADDPDRSSWAARRLGEIADLQGPSA